MSELRAGLRLQNRERAKRTTEVGRYSTMMVARLFGVTPNRVRDWIAYGYLQARRYEQINQRPYYVIDGRAMIDFMFARGGIMPFQPTTPEWIMQKERGRKHILATTITTTEICELLGVTRLLWPIERLGFPKACIELKAGQGRGPWRYKKTEVADWLDSYPRYDESGRRRKELRCHTDIASR